MGSIWRQPGSIYYHPDFHEVHRAVSSPPTLVPKDSEQAPTIQESLTLPKASKLPSQVGDQGQRAGVEKEKGKSKGKKLSAKAKDATKDSEAAAKAKGAEAETQEVDPKAKDAPIFQTSQKEDPPVPLAKAQPLGFPF